MSTTNTTTATTLTPVRVTKAMKYGAVIDMLNGLDVVTFESDNHIPVDFTREDAVAFLDIERESLRKKNSGKSDKLTEMQKLNMGFKDTIYAFLIQEKENFMPTDACKAFYGKTCGEILQGIPEFANHETILFSNQKIAALCNQLEKEGRAEKTTVKGRSYFQAVAREEEEV